MKNKPKLPKEEIKFLLSLSQDAFTARLRSLWEAGWSLGIIAESFTPPKPKSTIHFWVKNATQQEQIKSLPETPSKSLTVLSPVADTPRLRSISLGVPSELKPRLKHLSSLSRRYRSKSAANSELSIANNELTELAKSLHNRGVSTAAIAEAAGVTYRAMARRISNG